MIVRELADGTIILIPQTEHSRFVGRLASHWGNQRFAPPEPYLSVARAATYHDFGWLSYETRPLLNLATGLPHQFHDLPFSQEHLDAYQWCIDWLTGLDPYAGLLASQHRTGLWKDRYGALRQPDRHYGTPDPRPEVQAFLERNEAAQAALARRFDATQVRINYRLMQVWDQLGLYFCCRPPRPESVEPVPVAYSSAEGQGVELVLDPLSQADVRLTPYPFDANPMRVEVVYKLAPVGRFETQEAWQEAYYRAPSDLLSYTLVG
ncbi:MAG: DUF3891 family protein [Chloroflexota bacterium]